MNNRLVRPLLLACSAATLLVQVIQPAATATGTRLASGPSVRSPQFNSALIGRGVQGAELWVSRYHGPANGSNVAKALGVSPDGSTVFVTGDSNGSTGLADYATVAYTPRPVPGCGRRATTAQGTKMTSPTPSG